MDVRLVLQFRVIAVLLTLTPGADWAFAIAAGLRARSVVPPVLGMLFGYAIVITVVAVGVGSLVTRYPVALTALTIAGACYLLWLGSAALIRPVGQVTASDQPIGGSSARLFLRGAGVSGTNPKGLLLLLALLPQFISPHGWPPSAQMLVLGSLHLLDCAALYFPVALLARRVLRSRPRAAVLVTKISGTAMILIGTGLFIERILELLRLCVALVVSCTSAAASCICRRADPARTDRRRRDVTSLRWEPHQGHIASVVCRFYAAQCAIGPVVVRHVGPTGHGGPWPVKRRLVRSVLSVTCGLK